MEIDQSVEKYKSQGGKKLQQINDIMGNNIEINNKTSYVGIKSAMKYYFHRSLTIPFLWHK